MLKKMMFSDLAMFLGVAEEVILAEERTTEEEKMHIMEGEKTYINLAQYVIFSKSFIRSG